LWQPSLIEPQWLVQVAGVQQVVVVPSQTWLVLQQLLPQRFTCWQQVLPFGEHTWPFEHELAQQMSMPAAPLAPTSQLLVAQSLFLVHDVPLLAFPEVA
jgi:hypothetical protein